MRTADEYGDCERCAIMERIDGHCRTNCSPGAMATGRTQPFVTVWAFPIPDWAHARAEFAWGTADHITRTSRVFDLR